ncbi:MAG: ATP-binding protein [Myxococcota bacterium]
MVDFVRDFLRHNPQYADTFSEEGVLDHSDAAIAGLDSTMMRRVLVNLLDNACESIDEAGLPRTESIHVQITLPTPETVAVVVEDHGPGVPRDIQPRLFDPYFTTKADGTGLGLAIVRKIVIDHGGDITIRSPVTPDGAGTQMIIELPRLDRST